MFFRLLRLLLIIIAQQLQKQHVAGFILCTLVIIELCLPILSTPTPTQLNQGIFCKPVTLSVFFFSKITLTVAAPVPVVVHISKKRMPTLLVL